VGGKPEAPKHLARTVHDLSFEPKYEEFRLRTIWNLSNPITSAFKELNPIPQFKATAKPGQFLERQCLDCCRAGEKNLNATRSRFPIASAVGFLAEDITARSERVQNQSRFQSRQEFGSTWRAVGERVPIAVLPKYT
jgi:hypothetical protein